jgi:GntR family transcriptional repressor for pyruvate dehydrogenase complex
VQYGFDELHIKRGESLRPDLSNRPSIRTTSRDGLPERIAEKIEAFIAAEQMTSGMKLPGERVLGREFNVSRTVLREAIRILEHKGAVEVIPARGIFIANGAFQQTVNVLSEHLHREAIPLQELVDARRLLEVHIGALAAQNRSEDDLAALTESCAKLALLLDEPGAFLDEDMKFHALMARAAGNRLYSVWLEPIMANLMQVSPQALAWDVRERIVACHEAILRAVRAGDPDRAKKVVSRHIDQFVEDAQTFDRVVHRRNQRKPQR